MRSLRSREDDEHAEVLDLARSARNSGSRRCSRSKQRRERQRFAAARLRHADRITPTQHRRPALRLDRRRLHEPRALDLGHDARRETGLGERDDMRSTSATITLCALVSTNQLGTQSINTKQEHTSQTSSGQLIATPDPLACFDTLVHYTTRKLSKEMIQ